MTNKPCRDCGYLLDADARGCPRCALNLEAETMIERFVWRRLVPAMLIVGIVGVGILYYLFR